MRKPLDTSKAKCDTCGVPYQAGDAVYAIADKYDESNEKVDVLLSFRHWKCHTPIEKVFEDFREKAKKAQEWLEDIKKAY